jgi:hypothetical protein
VTRIFAAPPAEGTALRVEVPISSWSACDRGFRVRWKRDDGPAPSEGRLVMGSMASLLRPGDETSCNMTPLMPVAVVAEADANVPLVAGPALPVIGRTLDLVVVAGARVRVRCRPPASLDAAWPLTVGLSDGRAFLDGRPAVVERARLTGETTPLGPFAPGSYELVFRLAEREIGRRTIQVVAGSPVEVEGPQVRPPGR